MLCPLRVLAHESDYRNEENKGSIGYNRQIDVDCLKTRCAWWNEDFEMCSIAVLATTGTTPSNCNDSVNEALRMSTPIGGDQ